MSSALKPEIYARALIEATKEVSKEDAERRVETLVALLQKRGEGKILPKILEAAERMFEAAERVTLEVTAAKPLPQDEQALIASELGIEGKKILWVFHKDETVEGGIRLRIGDLVVDTSVQGKLTKLRQALLTA